MDGSRKIDWRLITAIVALAVSLFAGNFWHRADIVYDKRAVEIPLSDALRKSIEDALARSIVQSDSLTVQKDGKEISSSPHLPSTELPDKLLYVDLRNVGHVPSPRIIVRLVVPGKIADKQISDAGPAFGAITQVTESDYDGELSFECQNLANYSHAEIKVALWYQQTQSGSPSVEIEDTSEGPAREVSSVDIARFFWWEKLATLTVPLALVTAVLASLVTLFADRGLRRRRPNFTAVYEPLSCGWTKGSRNGASVMQVFAAASLATTEENPVEIVQAYLKGTKPIANLPQFLIVARESAVRYQFSFTVEPVVAQMGEAYNGRIVLVDKHRNEYTSEILSLPYRGPAT